MYKRFCNMLQKAFVKSHFWILIKTFMIENVWAKSDDTRGSAKSTISQVYLINYLNLLFILK